MCSYLVCLQPLEPCLDRQSLRLCREDAKTIESCCSEQVLALVTAEVESCKAKPQDPCAGLYGAEGLQCAWQEDAKTCIWVVIKSALQRLVVRCLFLFLQFNPE